MRRMNLPLPPEFEAKQLARLAKTLGVIVKRLWPGGCAII